jgi:Flp pilus assembly protein TadD/peroxiredoxin
MIKLSRPAAFFILLAGLAWGQQQTIQHAIDLQRSGDLEGAAREYRAILTSQPDEVGIRSNLGVVLSQLGRFDEAEKEYSEALRRDPSNPGIRLNLALVYYKSGRIPEAAAQLSDLNGRAGGNKQVILLLADCRLRMGENKQVIDLLQPLREKEPDDLGIAYLLGTALIRDQRVADGQIVIDRILRVGDSPEAHFLLGSQMFAAGDFPGAVKQFSRAAELNPNLPSLQSYYGQALLNTGDPDAASKAFRNELAREPNDFDANLRLAEILLERKNPTEAAPLLDRALRVRPRSVEARLDRAGLLASQSDWEAARLLLEALASEVPQAGAVHQQLAAVYQHLHKVEAAKRETALYAKLNPQEQDLKPAGLKTGAPAPDFRLPGIGSSTPVSLQSYRAKSPVLLVFGSYTCPNFRSAAPSLNQLYARYGKRIPFLLVYIREAHSTEDWQSTRNDRDGIVLPPAKTMDNKTEHAAMCTRKLNLAFPAVVDQLDGKVESAYAAWPSHAYLVDLGGTIRYSTGLSELEFHAADLEAALRRAIQ